MSEFEQHVVEGVYIAEETHDEKGSQVWLLHVPHEEIPLAEVWRMTTDDQGNWLEFIGEDVTTDSKVQPDSSSFDLMVEAILTSVKNPRLLPFLRGYLVLVPWPK